MMRREEMEIFLRSDLNAYPFLRTLRFTCRTCLFREFGITNILFHLRNTFKGRMRQEFQFDEIKAYGKNPFSPGFSHTFNSMNMKGLTEYCYIFALI